MAQKKCFDTILYVLAGKDSADIYFLRYSTAS